MKRAFLILTMLAAAAPLAAFDSAKWLAKREAMTADAERLRTAYTNCLANIDSPSEGLVIPLETNPDGSVRTEIHAERAQLYRDSPVIWAENLTLVKKDEDGTERMRLEAAKCVIDRVARCGWVEGHAKVTQGKTVFEGDGVYFSATNDFVTTYSQSDLKSSDLKFGGLK